MAQGIAKSLPKRATSAHAKEYRARAWVTGEQRKKLRQAENEKRHAVNVKAGKTPKRQTRKRHADNTRICLRCEKRRIVAGQVCWCRSIGIQSAA